MHQMMPKWTKTATMMLACGVLFIGGCSKDTSTSSEQSGDDAARDAGGNDAGGDGGDGGSGGDGADEISQLTPETFAQLKEMWTLQTAAPVAQADTLRKIEAEHNDAQLKDLIAQLDRKNAAIKAMLDNATVANGSKTLQVDVPKAMGEAGELVAKANERMQEVLKAKFGGGGGG